MERIKFKISNLIAFEAEFLKIDKRKKNIDVVFIAL